MRPNLPAWTVQIIMMNIVANIEHFVFIEEMIARVSSLGENPKGSIYSHNRQPLFCRYHNIMMPCKMFKELMLFLDSYKIGLLKNPYLWTLRLGFQDPEINSLSAERIAVMLDMVVEGQVQVIHD